MRIYLESHPTLGGIQPTSFQVQKAEHLTKYSSQPQSQCFFRGKLLKMKFLDSVCFDVRERDIFMIKRKDKSLIRDCLSLSQTWPGPPGGRILNYPGPAWPGGGGWRDWGWPQLRSTTRDINTSWLVPSKPLVNPLEEKLPGSSWPPRLPESPLHLQEE